MNYNQTIKHPPDDFICKCQNYDSIYVDSFHKHIITGNLQIVKNEELRTLMEKGLGYHEQQPPNKSKAYKSFTAGIDAYIYKVSNSTNIPVQKFLSWKSELLSRIKSKLDNTKAYGFNNVLLKPHIKNVCLNSIKILCYVRWIKHITIYL